MKRLVPFVSISVLFLGCSSADSTDESLGEVYEAINCSAPGNPDEVNRCAVRSAVMASSGTGPDTMLSAPPFTADFQCVYEPSSTLTNYAEQLLGRPGQIGLFPGALHSQMAASTRDLNGPKLSNKTRPATVEINGISVKAGASLTGPATMLTRG